MLFTSRFSHSQACNANIQRTAPDSRYELVVGSGGSEVLDKKTKLIWQRCSLGQSWNGITCVGTGNAYSWTDAILQAKSVGNDYRLPNIKELESLVEESCYGNSINENYFLNTPTSPYWSASPSIYYSNYALIIKDFYTGDSGDATKDSKNMIRAVRSSKQ